MAINTSLEPIDPGDFGYAQAAHLLSRAGFGGGSAEVLTLQLMGLDQAVDFIVDYENIDDSGLEQPQFDPGIIRPVSDAERAKRTKALREGNTSELQNTELEQQRRRAKDLFQMREIERWWLERMVQTPRPLEERLTLLWHSHFPSSYRVVSDSYLMFQQNQLFRAGASGSVADLLMGVVRDPATLLYLNNDSNHKAAPNEQMAGVLLERFALGPDRFTSRDVRDSAKALTGYGVHDNSFFYHAEIHDQGPKAVLGERGNLNGDDLAALLLRKPACHAWVARRFYDHFVADLDDPTDAASAAVVQEMARLLADYRFKIAAVLKRVFKSQHFYDPGIVGNKIKTPTQLLIGTARLLRTPPRDPEKITLLMKRMGQRLFEPPSYHGWPTGRSWLNNATLRARHNLCAYLITGKLAGSRQWSAAGIGYDPQPLLENLPVASGEAVVDYLSGMMLTVPLAPERRGALLDFIRKRKKITSHTLIAVLLLITTVPEYQLC